MSLSPYITITLISLGTASLEIAGQTSEARVAISATNTNVVVSWNGRGTLQSADSPGQWTDILEASNPFITRPTNTHQFFRGISRWSTRRPLLEANSEMAVAELEGKIYVLGGYPSSRVTVRTVQVYDPELDQWSLTAPLPVALNHTMPAVVNGKLYIIGGQTDAGNTSFVNTVYEFDPRTTNW